MGDFGTCPQQLGALVKLYQEDHAHERAGRQQDWAGNEVKHEELPTQPEVLSQHLFLEKSMSFMWGGCQIKEVMTYMQWKQKMKMVLFMFLYNQMTDISMAILIH